MIVSKKKSRFIAGWETDFANKDELTKILLTQGVDRYGFKVFSELQTATEIVIENKKIVKSIKHSQGSKEIENLDCELPIDNWINRKVFFLTQNERGIHNIGGVKPDDFTLPTSEKLRTPFIYIGTLNPSDNNFAWINMPKLNLAYPIFECSYGIYLDYQNPNIPIIINQDTFDDSWYNAEAKGFDKVIFEQKRFNSVGSIDLNSFEYDNDGILICGVPLWLQAPEIPMCPKSGKIMEFVCSINSDSSISIINNEGIENTSSNDLNFGDHGYLYIWYQPDSKVIYMNIQF